MILEKDFTDTAGKMGCFVGHVHIGPVGKMVDKDGNELISVFCEETRTVTLKLKED